MKLLVRKAFLKVMFRGQHNTKQSNMAAVADLTKTEVSAEISDTALKTWWDAAPALPGTVGMAELMIKLAQALYIGQVKKNTAAGTPTPLVAGEALASYAAPLTGTVTLDVASGLQFFNQSVTISALTTTNSDITVPARA